MSDLVASLLESDLERARIEATARAVEERLLPRLFQRSPGVDPFTSYTLDDAATRMNISRYDLDRLRAKNLLNSRQVGGKTRVLERDIQRYYEKQEVSEFA